MNEAKAMIPLGEWKRTAREYFKEVTHATEEKAVAFADELARKDYLDFAGDPRGAVVHSLKQIGAL